MKNKCSVMVCDDNVDVKWNSTSFLENCNFQWDVRITGRKMRVQIDAFSRATDIRFLYLGLTEAFASLMPFINNLSQKSRDRRFSHLSSYTSLRHFLGNMKMLAYAMLLCGGENLHFDQSPHLNVNTLNELVGRDLLKIRPGRRFPLLVKAWKEKFNMLMDLFSNNLNLLFLEYYLDGKLTEYPPSWLKELVNITGEAKRMGFRVLLPLKDKSLYDYLREIPLNVVLVDQQSLKFYESLLEIACDKAQVCYSLFDIVGYLYGNVSSAYTGDVQKTLDELVSQGLLKKVEGKYVIEY
ncbi:MAG: hypothetical protein ACTSWP_01530 [Candidatus Freyarchaeota archaeon]